MGRKKKGKAAKNANTGDVGNSEEEFKKSPHTFVISRGHVGKNVTDLIMDVRKVMQPYTAGKLKVRKKNVLKDFVSIAGALNVTHLMTFTKTEVATNMRLMRLPRGPTLTFKVHNYSLVKDVISMIKHHHTEQKQFTHHPLLVMNNFSGEGMQMKLMATMFQNMFPSINVNKVKLNNIRRCVLINYNSETETLDFRHYNLKAVPVGMSRGVKKLVKARIPNMAKYQDVSEFLMKDGNLSESEAELDGPHNEVVLPQHISGRGNMKASKSALRLTEIGPRMKLELVKIEEGLCDGDVLYHKFVEKTENELKDIKAIREKKRKLKAQRKKQQKDNVEQKEKLKEEIKKKTLAGMKKEVEDEDSDVEDPESKGGKNGYASDEQDDIDYYRQEVGEEPDPDLMIAGKSKWKGKPGELKRKSQQKSSSPFKKQKFDNKTEEKSSTPFKKQKADRKQQKDINIKQGKQTVKDKKPKTIQDELNLRRKRKMQKNKKILAKRTNRRGRGKKF